MAVEVGLVDGTTAATTPNGSAISMTRAVFVARDDADRLHRPDEVVDLLRSEEVLLNLVGDDAVAGFFDGEPRERFGLRRGGRGHRVDDGVDAFLAELGELEPRLLGAARERARLGDRGQIAIGLRRDGRHRLCGPSTAGRRSGVLVLGPFGRIRSTSACGRGMTWTETSSPTRRAAAAPASVAALTAPTSPRTMTVT